jgi:dTDP-glucose 4,6-dehydratase
MRILVTGGAGFIGSNFIRLALADEAEPQIYNFDLLTYAGNLANLTDIADSPRYRFVKGDIADRDAAKRVFDEWKPEYVVHFAAESHVDRALEDAGVFVRTNVLGTQNLLECARRFEIKRMLHVSTDEVYGALPDMDAPPFTEDTPLAPRNPYSASKAAADHLVMAAYHTHKLPVVITRSGNNYGPYQFPEKLIPLFITNLMEGKQVPLYGEGLNVRDWIHVRDNCRAIFLALKRGTDGQVYNIGPGESEPVTNLRITMKLLELMGAGAEMIRRVADRLGHDFRYALDTSKIERELGFKAGIPLDDGLRDTVEWYKENEAWWRAIKTGEYLDYYERMYGKR